MNKNIIFKESRINVFGLKDQSVLVIEKSYKKYDCDFFFNFINESLIQYKFIIIDRNIADYVDLDIDFSNAEGLLLKIMANSVGSCFVFDAYKVNYHLLDLHSCGFLITNKTYGYVLSSKHSMNEDNFDISFDVDIDIYEKFLPYRSLWINDINVEEHFNSLQYDDYEIYLMYCFRHIGKALGEIHSKQCLHGDAHKDHFLVDIENDDKVGIIDWEAGQLYFRPLRSHERAYDISFLLPSMTPSCWYVFKHSYILHSDNIDENAVLAFNNIEKRILNY